jgi:hypothetical protein
MSKSRRREQVHRAEFRDWIISTHAGPRIDRGKFVVEVRNTPELAGAWTAMVNGDRGRVICFGPSASKCKAKVREHFTEALTDWVVGEYDGGQWRPLSEYPVLLDHGKRVQ